MLESPSPPPESKPPTPQSSINDLSTGTPPIPETPLQETQPSSPTPPLKKSKKPISLGLSILSLILLGGAGYFLYNNYFSKTPAP